MSLATDLAQAQNATSKPALKCLEPFPLSLLAPELLGLVTRLLTGLDIAALYLTGNGSLTHRLKAPGAVPVFSILVRHPTQVGWPRLALHFRHLVEFSLWHSGDMRRIPVEDVCIQNLPSTLRSLRLHFVNSFASLHAPSNSDPACWTLLPLGTVFPSLETLHYMPQKYQTVSELKSLPTSLTSLNVGRNFAPSSLALLPRYLTQLEASFSTTQDWKDDAISFPNSLLNLTVKEVNSCELLRHLPAQLKDLRVSYSKTAIDDWKKADDVTFGAKWLPLELRSFLVESPHKLKLTVEFAQSLPRSIELLNIWCEDVSLKDVADALLKLPSNLQDVQLRGVNLGHRQSFSDHKTAIYAATKHITANLQNALPLSWSTLFHSDTAWPLIPSSLRKFSGNILYPDLIRLLPKTLVSLYGAQFALREGGTVQFHAWSFPPSLETVTVQYLSAQGVFSAILEQCKGLRALTLHPESWKQIPSSLVSGHPSLRQLGLQSDGYPTNHELPILPEMPHLDTLWLSRCEPSGPDSILSFCNSLPSASLTDLQLSFVTNAQVRAADVQCILNGDKLPNLVALYIYPIHGLSNELVSRLPRRLTSLTLGGTSNITDEALTTFPKSLLVLSLDCENLSLSGLLHLPNLFFFSGFNSARFPAWEEYCTLRSEKWKQKFGPLVQPES